jgi:hypothetical protein
MPIQKYEGIESVLLKLSAILYLLTQDSLRKTMAFSILWYL